VITKALLEGGRHKVTAISREDSKATVPDSVEVKRILYDDHASLVSALRGQDILVISLNPQAPKDTQIKLIDAAKDAGLKWIMPKLVHSFIIGAATDI
jgi:putative NADH-flavin reductase